ncbi:bifunctional allantoicase/(S)-ureidoglycine aminohydrolase [Marimonas arenosa]|uniref:Bifunctional allantoicase/(S)-ureidoglycine aminohydrolase n=1 Tax=Marimonas arenosa TaxID=1795305 RepID=A0AAE4B3A5_9RHOB|nr:bifunctional allantoicase/(S)-ureidoglycine aminohydrolase [Marimonas arenosa]MDQ2089853.1 bifunctional allantoicase/(S)-ureidoglycine aminohydrolase [Marimonas arenosa]
MSYAFPPGGLPEMDASPEGRARFTEAYAVLPANTMRDIVTSLLPGWEATRAWVLARPLSGFAETFAQYAVEVQPGGGSDTPEPDPQAQASLFVAAGSGRLTVEGRAHDLEPGHYAYLPAGTHWQIHATGEAPLQVHWIRKRYDPAPGLSAPGAFVLHERDVPLNMMPGTEKWGTQRFADPNDLRFDYHVNIVTFQPGGRIPFAETHVMEHGLYVLQGQANYLLNRDWVEVGPGDFMWLRAFCPQACIAEGSEPFRYLLYKDVNRHVPLGLYE